MLMKSKEPKPFCNDDEGFIKWRNANPNGFVLNLPLPSVQNKRHFFLRAVKLHSAECPTLKKNTKGDKHWTTKKYFKVCAHDASDLVNWFDDQADKPASWKLPRCKSSKCKV